MANLPIRPKREIANPNPVTAAAKIRPAYNLAPKRPFLYSGISAKTRLKYSFRGQFVKLPNR